MFAEIAVPLDGSALAERALAAARALAGATGARVRLIRPLLTGPGGAEWPPAGPREAYRYLDRPAGDLAAAGIAAEALVHPGDAEELVLEELHARRPDLLILPLPVHAGLRDWVAAAEAALAQTTVPLLLVPSWGATLPPAPAGRRLLVPLDGTPTAEVALPFAASLASRLAGELVLLHAIAPGGHRERGAGRAPLGDEGDAERYLRQIARRTPLDARAVRVDVRPGCPIAAITAAGRDHGAAMAVMALDRPAGGRRHRLGPVLCGVLRRGELPTMLLRGAGVPSRRASTATRRGLVGAARPLPGATAVGEGAGGYPAQPGRDAVGLALS